MNGVIQINFNLIDLIIKENWIGACDLTSELELVSDSEFAMSWIGKSRHIQFVVKKSSAIE